MTTPTANETALYLTFKLDDELFAVVVSQVREVLEMEKINKVPRTQDFMLGVINVRGSVIPVLDLRRKFGFTEVETTLYTRIIVLELFFDGEVTVIGAIADSVHDVLELEAGQIEPPPRIGNRWRMEFIQGVGNRDGQFIMILDINKAFSVQELTLNDQGTESLETSEESQAVTA